MATKYIVDKIKELCKPLAKPGRTFEDLVLRSIRIYNKRKTHEYRIDTAFDAVRMANHELWVESLHKKAN